MDFWQMFSTTLGSAAVMAAVIVLYFSLNRKNNFYKKHKNANIVLSVIIFGALSVYASVSAIEVNGALCNCRNLAPLFAGLVLGPWAGIGSAVIGGLFRFFVYGGPSAMPCLIACLVAGVLGSVLHVVIKKKKIKYNFFFAVAVSAAVEGCHMGLLCAFGLASIAELIALPIILSNICGMAFSIYMTKVFFTSKEELA